MKNRDHFEPLIKNFWLRHRARTTVKNYRNAQHYRCSVTTVDDALQTDQRRRNKERHFLIIHNFIVCHCRSGLVEELRKIP